MLNVEKSNSLFLLKKDEEEVEGLMGMVILYLNEKKYLELMEVEVMRMTE